MKKIIVALADAVRETPAFMWRQLYLGKGPEWAYAFFPAWISFELLFLANQVQPHYHLLAYEILLYSGVVFVMYIVGNVLRTAVARYDQFRGVEHQYRIAAHYGRAMPAWLVQEYRRIS